MVLFSVFALALLVGGPILSSAAMPEQETAAKAVNAFAIDLYKQIRTPEGNLFFSPYSVSLCLAMAYTGARGNTASQMASALHFESDQESMGRSFRALNGQIAATAQGKAVELNIANALWAEKSCFWSPGFLSSAGAGYGVGLRLLDFRNRAEAERRIINLTVEDQTKHKIKDLLPPGAITSNTRLVLTNAIYFKGLWEFQFKKERTKEAPFTLLDGKEVNVPTMRNTDSFGYAQEEGLQLLEMLYKGEELAMVVLLPLGDENLEGLEQSLTLEKFADWIGKLRIQTVEVHLPRFKMTSEFRLRSALTRLGMTDAFSMADADFSGMTGKKDLFIGEAFHKAFVEVNEEGTEAAAATGFVVPAGRLPLPPPPTFRADHPFLFLIRHKPSNCILFFGRVTKP
jgi:serine protease inhibitor